MREDTNNSEQSLEITREKIIESYLTAIDDSFRENRPQLKLVNYGTGSGKTHQLFKAICQTIRSRTGTQIIGIYIAPLREHLNVPDAITESFPEIPVYKIHSQEMQTTDDYIQSYKQWIPSILEDNHIWQKDSREPLSEQSEKKHQELTTLKQVIAKFEYFKKNDFRDNDFQRNQIEQAKRDIRNLFEKFLSFLIEREPNENNWSEQCLELIKIFFPLYLLREKSGIVMLTYHKFETEIPYFIYKNGKWSKTIDTLDKYTIHPTHQSRKCIIAFDEQEDGYEIILKKQIDIISPQKLAINNALSSIHREFSILESDNNRRLLEFLEKNKGAYHELAEHFGKGKPLESSLEEFASIYKKLILEEGNSIEFLRKVSTILNGLDKSIRNILETRLAYSVDQPVALNLDVVFRAFSKFQNNRSLLIDQELYNKYSHELMNIFSYNNLYIYNIEPLQKLFIMKSSTGHVQISETKGSKKTSLAELIYAIFALRSQIDSIQKFLANVLQADDSQSRSLEIWSKQISKAQKAIEDNKEHHKPHKYINRSYVYESYKSMINIREISRYQNPKNNLINHSLTEVSIGSTAINTSPEYKLKSMLSNNNNVAFLISATGGIIGDLSTSYDLRYLKDNLQFDEEKSSFHKMTQEEISLCEEIRVQRQATREISVDFFHEDILSFPNSQTQEIVQQFMSTALKSFISNSNPNNSWHGLNKYKIQELKRFIAFLYYLFEDDCIHETIAFTQSIRWIQKLLDFCVVRKYNEFHFQNSSDHPNIYYATIDHPRYKSDIRIKIIVYEASFKDDYIDNENQKTYLQELVREENQKIFFISAYKSASKGLNPVITTQDGKEKDFDSLVLLMDSYYTVMKNKTSSKKIQDPDSETITTRYHFSVMKSLVRLGDDRLEIQKFNEYLTKPEAFAFREQQHQILLGKEILQAIGRCERRDFTGQIIKIFINEETRHNLVNFYRYLEQNEPNEIRKLSVNNYQVYLRVTEEEKKRSIEDYEEHIDTEIEADDEFNSFKKILLDKISRFHQDPKSTEIVKQWSALRDPVVFTDPEMYLKKLRESGLFPETFIDSLFYHNPDRPEFTPYLASEINNDRKIDIISDSVNGDRIYPYQSRLYPEYLKSNVQDDDWEEIKNERQIFSIEPIYKLYNDLLPAPEIFNTYIPRPPFFYDILYPSLAENFVERWIEDAIFQNRDWEKIKRFYSFERLRDFKKYNKLYEKFDLYYVRGNELFCIDVKAWSKSSGDRLSQGTLKKAKDKLKEISSDYREFSSVNGLLLNLRAIQEKSNSYSSNLFELWTGSLFYLNEDNCPVESKILRNFLRLKES